MTSHTRHGFTWVFQVRHGYHPALICAHVKPPIRLPSWLKEGILDSPIIFPTAPSSRLYWTPRPILRAVANLINVSEYWYGGTHLSLVCVADLVLPLRIVLYEHIRLPFDVLFVVRLCHGRDDQMM